MKHVDPREMLYKAWESPKFRFGCIFSGIIIVLLYLLLTIIPPGHVGIVVNLLGENQGVDLQEKQVGLHLIPPWKQICIFPTFQQNYSWEGGEGFTFQTSEGLGISADIGITYSLDPHHIPTIFQRYRRGMDEITDIFIRNHIRDAINKHASHMRIEDLYGEKKEAFFDLVQRQVQQDLNPQGFHIHRIYLIGRIHFPDSVVHALNLKIEATQRAQQRENELREAEAEAKKRIASAQGAASCALLAAEAQAQANNTISKSLTPELVRWQAVQKWNGELPKVTTEHIPLIQVQ